MGVGVGDVGPSARAVSSALVFYKNNDQYPEAPPVTTQPVVYKRDDQFVEDQVEANPQATLEALCMLLVSRFLTQRSALTQFADASATIRFA